MPTYRIGDMWSEYNEVDYFIITTNSTIKSFNDALVMGAGIAKQVRDSWPHIDVRMGKAILKVCESRGTYGLILGNKIGLFQVKYHYKDWAQLPLIQKSTDMLIQHAIHNPTKMYALNYPGIGNGKLSIDQVKPIIDELPMNVHVWRSSDG